MRPCNGLENVRRVGRYLPQIRVDHRTRFVPVPAEVSRIHCHDLQPPTTRGDQLVLEIRTQLVERFVRLRKPATRHQVGHRVVEAALKLLVAPKLARSGDGALEIGEAALVAEVQPNRAPQVLQTHPELGEAEPLRRRASSTRAAALP